MIKINGTTIKTPSAFKVDLQDLDVSAERNANGYLFRERVAMKRKLFFEFAGLTDKEISDILSAIQDVFFDCEFPDPLTGEMYTINCYVGDRSAVMYNFKRTLWEGLSFNLIER